MPVEFLTDEQAARYGRFVEVPSRAALDRLCFPDDAAQPFVPFEGAGLAADWAIDGFKTWTGISPGEGFADESTGPSDTRPWNPLHSWIPGNHKPTCPGYRDDTAASTSTSRGEDVPAGVEPTSRVAATATRLGAAARVDA